VAGVLVAGGHTVPAIVVTAAGMTVLFIADHFVRPTMIGSATKLPFLAVLFGILGGVETMGLVGLFIGPVVMTLFVTLWHEEDLFGDQPAA
jgi:predicted PurR-regulated permease PerM